MEYETCICVYLIMYMIYEYHYGYTIMCTYTYIRIYVCIYIYIRMYIERERIIYIYIASTSKISQKYGFKPWPEAFLAIVARMGGDCWGAAEKVKDLIEKLVENPGFSQGNQLEMVAVPHRTF